MCCEGFFICEVVIEVGCVCFRVIILILIMIFVGVLLIMFEISL